MNDNIEKLIIALDSLGDLFRRNPNQTQLIFNTKFVPLSYADLSLIPLNIIDKLKKVNSELINQKEEELLILLVGKIEIFINRLSALGQANTQLIGGNFLALMQFTETIVDSLVSPDWETIDESMLPKNLIKRIKQEERSLNKFIEDKEGFSEKISAINKAAPFVDTLSEKLGDINALEEEIRGYKKVSIELQNEISNKKDEAEKLTEGIREFETEIQQIIDKANRAYKISTTNGLAGEFDKSAKSLKKSIVFWLLGLLAALCLGICIGHERFAAVNSALKTPGFSSSHIWILIFLAVLSLGAPIWFAWLATKQINQRFKLAEDYAFKATISKAYEGYRSEAIRINPDMEARLFASALSRLDEQPLRFVDKDNHGSPWQELLNNPAIMKLLKEKPDSLVEFLKEFAASYFSKKQDS